MSSNLQRRTAVLLLGLVILAVLPVTSQVRLPSPPAAGCKYWVFFRDKGAPALAKKSMLLQEAQNRLTPRALMRRAKVMRVDQLITEEDFPVAAEYAAVLRGLGFAVIRESRWLNAVSVLASDTEARSLRALPFVKEVRPVARLRRPPEPGAAGAPPALLKPTSHRLNYGNSLFQNEQLQIPVLHDAGINGKGVLVGMLDSGFHYQDHEALRATEIIAEYDFVNSDSVTRNETQQEFNSYQDDHGTQTLATISAFYPGLTTGLIGPAYGAQYILAKTENLPTESHAEEDNWVVAVEWMEGYGVEVTSTSLGYSTFDDPTTNYTYADMNGRTTIITKAAEMAAARGVVVAVSAGNEGGSSWHYITAPADGVNVLAVGAVAASGQRASFSGFGPTYDGRIKPDVAALGIGVVTVRPSSTTALAASSGTSFSCPLVAGVAAQVLSAHPELTPAQVYEALRQTASQAAAPDNSLGYGIVNAKAAVTYHGPAFSNFPEISSISANELGVTIRVLSRGELQSSQTFMRYAINTSPNFLPVAMTQIDSISYIGALPRLAITDTFKLYFSVREVNASTEVTYPKGAPGTFLRMRGDGQLLPEEPPEKPQMPVTFALFQNYPNPVYLARSGATTIRFQLQKAEPVTVKIFNRIGQEVVTLAASRFFGPGTVHTLSWDGRDGAGNQVASGVYFCQLSAGAGRLVRRMLLLR